MPEKWYIVNYILSQHCRKSALFFFGIQYGTNYVSRLFYMKHPANQVDMLLLVHSMFRPKRNNYTKIFPIKQQLHLLQNTTRP